MPVERTSARVGPLEFHSDFADPYVDVDKEMRTADHETINDNFVVQVLGRKPDKITIEGIVYDFQLDDADQLISSGQIDVRTDRWSGTAVVTNVSTTFRREADSQTGRWAYDITIDLTEVEGMPYDVYHTPGDPDEIGETDVDPRALRRD